MYKTLTQTLLAVFCAILAHTSLEGGGVMLIGARNGMLAGGKLSAKSYIQDGLVAMWDGIENAGWGAHDANAANWVDLSGNNNHLTGVNAVWNDDEAVFNGTSCFYRAMMPSVVCAEIVFRASTDYRFAMIYQNSDYHVVGWNGREQSVPPDKVLIVLGTTTYMDKPSFYVQRVATRRNFSAFFDPYWTLRVNNTLLQNMGKIHNGAAGDRLYIGRREYSGTASGWLYGGISCIRLHSRFPTDDELAANYAVDKARFNLP